MLGTQAQYPNQYPTEAKPIKSRGWRKLVIVLVLLALVGIGGWWIYQNSTAGQAQSAPGQMTNISGPAATGQLPGSGTPGAENAAVGQAPSTGTAASTGSVSAGQPAIQASTSTDPAADPVLKLASLAGVAEVGGTPVWSDDGTLLATLESGAILTVKARTSDGAWLAVTSDAGSGWAQTPTVIAYGLHNLTTAAVPAAVALANAQAGRTADPSAAGASLSLADLAPTSSANGAQLAQAASVQLTAQDCSHRFEAKCALRARHQLPSRCQGRRRYRVPGRWTQRRRRLASASA